MRRQVLSLYLAVFCAIAWSASGSKLAQGAGYWNVPSNFGQRTGHGFGGGYHAPWILGPIQHDGCYWGKPTRLPYAPTPYYGCTSCDGGGRFVESPTAMEGAVPTTPASWSQPTVPASVEETRSAEAAPVIMPDKAMPEPEPIVEPTVAPANEPTNEPVKPLFTAPPVQR